MRRSCFEAISEFWVSLDNFFWTNIFFFQALCIWSHVWHLNLTKRFVLSRRRRVSLDKKKMTAWQHIQIEWRDFHYNSTSGLTLKNLIISKLIAVLKLWHIEVEYIIHLWKWAWTAVHRWVIFVKVFAAKKFIFSEFWVNFLDRRVICCFRTDFRGSMIKNDVDIWVLHQKSLLVKQLFRGSDFLPFL